MNISAIASALWISLCCATIAILLALPIAMALAWWLARTTSRTRVVVELFVMLPMVVPPVVTGYVLLITLGRHGQWAGLVFTWWGAAIAQAVIALPLMILTLRVAIESVDHELETAAAQMGATPLGVFRHVTLPLSWHGLAAGCVLGFARAIGEFGATIVVAGNIAGQTRTLPLAIYTSLNTPSLSPSTYTPDTTLLGLTLTAIAMALVTLILSRYLAGRAMRWRW